MTPEGRVKAKVDALLKQFRATYYLKPVQNGMGAPALDYHGIHCGIGFAIETKRPGKEPTPRQEHTARRIMDAGGIVFMIDGDLQELTIWLAVPTIHFRTKWMEQLCAQSCSTSKPSAQNPTPA